jgi:hypothetical protein
MRTSILSDNISSKMEIAEIIEPFFIPPQDQIRYRIKLYQTIYNAIPIINSTIVYKAGDQVIVLFKNSQVEDTPFIIGRFNQIKPEETLLISSIQTIKKPEDREAIKYETDYSIFQMDSKNKRILIGNKDSASGKIVIDNNEVIIGDINLTKMANSLTETITQRLNDKIISSQRSIVFEAETGDSTTKAQQVNFFSGNFQIKNQLEMVVETPHLNLSSSFLEFNVITPKAYNLTETKAFSFFALDGDFNVSLGKGDFKTTVALPTSYIELLVAPLSEFSGTESSYSGIAITPFGIDMSYLFGASKFEIGESDFTFMIGAGSLFFETFQSAAGLYNISILGGTATITLTSAGFFVTVNGNTLSLTSAGLTVTNGNIMALIGDVMAGPYSLMRHMHPTAIPGGPSPPLPL